MIRGSMLRLGVESANRTVCEFLHDLILTGGLPPHDSGVTQALAVSLRESARQVADEAPQPVQFRIIV